MTIAELQKISDELCREMDIDAEMFRWYTYGDDRKLAACHVQITNSATIELERDPTHCYHHKRLVADVLSEAHKGIIALCQETVEKLGEVLDGKDNLHG